VETSSEGAVDHLCLYSAGLELPFLIEDPLLEVLAFVVITGFLFLLGEGLGLGHGLPGVIEEVLVFSFRCTHGGELQNSSIGLLLLLLPQD
jgi:hypothetical protein